MWAKVMFHPIYQKLNMFEKEAVFWETAERLFDTPEFQKLTDKEQRDVLGKTFLEDLEKVDDLSKYSCYDSQMKEYW